MPSPKIKIVPDTSFYIAAALQDGYARRYLVGRGSAFLTYELVTSHTILLETQEKLENHFQFGRSRAVTAIRQITAVATIVHPTQKLNIVRDPDDNKIIECAVEAHADIIISFDKDLLDLKLYEGIQFVHPGMLKYWFRAKT